MKKEKTDDPDSRKHLDNLDILHVDICSLIVHVITLSITFVPETVLET